jgi:peptidoglycan/LPS O-acetylase OafA/YrhL
VSAKDYALNLTMFSGFAGLPYVDSVYWSLLVEMKFYLLVFVVLLFKQIRHAKIILTVWLVVYAVHVFHPIKYVGFFLLPDNAPYFIAGAMFYLVAKEGVDLWKGAVLLGCYALATYQSIDGLRVVGVKYHIVYSPIVIAVAMALFWLVFLGIATGRTARFGSKRWVVLGALTYPLYLIHQYIGFTIINALHGQVNLHLLFWGVVLLMILTAYGVNQIEKVVAPPLKRVLLKVMG